MKKILVVLMIFIVIFSTSMMSFASSVESDKLYSGIETLTDITETKQIFEGELINVLSDINIVEGESLNVVENKEGEFIVNENDMAVTIPKDVSKCILVEDNESDVTINLAIEGSNFSEPEVIDDTVVYEAKVDDSLLGIDVLDGGIRQTFVLENEDAEKEFTVKYNASNIGYMNFAYDENGKTDGSVLIYDKNGEIITGISVPWAKDKNGNNVNTHYEINGTQLTQVIEPNINNEYPIVADPLTYTSFFESSKWIWRSNADYKRSLSIEPKWRACGYSAGLSAWPYLKKKHESSQYWKNTSGLKDQFLCHANFAHKFKTPWNIEPGRPDRSYPATVAARCNPK